MSLKLELQNQNKTLNMNLKLKFKKFEQEKRFILQMHPGVKATDDEIKFFRVEEFR